MKKYLISSSKYTGEVELVYSPHLEIVDFSKTDMSIEGRQWMVRRIPSHSDGLPELIAGTGAVIVEENVVVHFEDWWKLYNKKINKDRALKLWDKISDTEKQKAWVGTIKYNRHLSKNLWQNKADPETFIRNKYWNNDYK